MRHRSNRRLLARGFTLIEATLATIIVGTGVLAAVQLFGTCAQQNMHSAQATVAMSLANNVQEAMGGLAFYDPQFGHAIHGPESGESLNNFDDLDDFNNLTFNPPIDANKQSLAEMAKYSQIVTVRPVWPDQPSSNNNDVNPTISAATYTGAVRIRVRVLYRPVASAAWEDVYQRSWVRMDD